MVGDLYLVGFCMGLVLLLLQTAAFVCNLHNWFWLDMSLVKRCRLCGDHVRKRKGVMRREFYGLYL